jgi:hypothetical protein
VPEQGGTLQCQNKTVKIGALEQNRKKKTVRAELDRQNMIARTEQNRT